MNQNKEMIDLILLKTLLQALKQFKTDIWDKYLPALWTHRTHGHDRLA